MVTLTDVDSIVAAIMANKYMPPNTRTYLMVATNIPTVAGFAMIAWCKGTAPRLIGYCTLFVESLRRRMLICEAGITGASNATFVVGLSLVSGNVGGAHALYLKVVVLTGV